MVSIVLSENHNLLVNIFFGFALDIISFKENLNKDNNFRNLRPELVEKKEPPITISIKKINDRCLGIFSRETPILEILLVIDKKIIPKFTVLSVNKKKKKINISK